MAWKIERRSSLWNGSPICQWWLWPYRGCWKLIREQSFATKCCEMRWRRAKTRFDHPGIWPLCWPIKPDFKFRVSLLSPAKFLWWGFVCRQRYHEALGIQQKGVDQCTLRLEHWMAVYILKKGEGGNSCQFVIYSVYTEAKLRQDFQQLQRNVNCFIGCSFIFGGCVNKKKGQWTLFRGK